MIDYQAKRDEFVALAVQHAALKDLLAELTAYKASIDNELAMRTNVI
jgi:hypothetical protein